MTMRALCLSALLLFVFGCHEAERQPVKVERVTVEKIPDEVNVVVIAPKELILAKLVIDGKEERTLWPDTLINHPRWFYVRSLIGLDPPSPSAAKARLHLAQGSHAMMIQGEGYMPISRSITVGYGIAEMRIGPHELVKDERATRTLSPAREQNDRH